MSNRTVCFFLPSFAGGGAERVMISLANAFADDGLAIHICVANSSGPRKAEVDTRITINDLNQPRLSLAMPELIRYFKTTKPTVVYVSMIHANIIASLAVMLSRCGSRIVLREAVSLQMLKNEVSFLPRLVWIQLAKIAYRRADCVVSVSQAIRDELVLSLGLESDDVKNRVIYNAIDKNYRELMRQAPTQVPTWFEQYHYVIGVGRLTKQKGFDTLIQAVALANQSLANEVGIIILGEGEERAALETEIKNLGIKHAFLAGYVENPYPLLSTSAAYVLSSRFEGLPNAMLQALACGTEVISTDCPTGPHEVLEGGRWGRLVPVDDVTAMAAAIVDVVSQLDSTSVARRKATIDEDAELVHLNRFSFKTMVEQYKACGQL